MCLLGVSALFRLISLMLLVLALKNDVNFLDQLKANPNQFFHNNTEAEEKLSEVIMERVGWSDLAFGGILIFTSLWYFISFILFHRSSRILLMNSLIVIAASAAIVNTSQNYEERYYSQIKHFQNDKNIPLINVMANCQNPNISLSKDDEVLKEDSSVCLDNDLKICAGGIGIISGIFMLFACCLIWSEEEPLEFYFDLEGDEPSRDAYAEPRSKIEKTKRGDFVGGGGESKRNPAKLEVQINENIETDEIRNGKIVNNLKRIAGEEEDKLKGRPSLQHIPQNNMIGHTGDCN